MSDLFETEIDSGSKCPNGHALMFVAEGYAVCYDPDSKFGDKWWAWRKGTPLTSCWNPRSELSGERYPDGWWEGLGIVYFKFAPSREDCLAFIQADIDAHRSLPFDEEAERARLVAV